MIQIPIVLYNRLVREVEPLLSVGDYDKRAEKEKFLDEHNIQRVEGRKKFFKISDPYTFYIFYYSST